jgi:hypothetical protein
VGGTGRLESRHGGTGGAGQAGAHRGTDRAGGRRRRGCLRAQARTGAWTSGREAKLQAAARGGIR